MKKILIFLLCLLTACCILSSCASRSSVAEFFLPGSERGRSHYTDRDSDGFRISMPDENAGEYHADSEGKVKNYSSDNNFTF